MEVTGSDSISLEEYALDEVVRQFLNGNGRISATKLPEDVSNKIYKRLILERVNFTHEQIENLTQSLTITRAVVNGTKCPGIRDGPNPLEVNLLAFQKLQELKLVGSWGKTFVGMAPFLEAILKSSRESLKTLIIVADLMKLKRYWVSVLKCIAPCLNAFHFYGTPMYDRDFKKLASMFPALIGLTCENTWMNSVKPISRLKNITSLSLAGVHFGCTRSLRAIFELSNLQELDISYVLVSSNNQLSWNLRYFLECKKVLPQLTFIDCSYNFVGKTYLEGLIESHTRLKTISIIGTNLERTPLTLEREVQLLSIASVLPTMATARVYTRKVSRLNCLSRVLNVLNEQLEIHFNEGGPSLWSNPEVSGCFIDLFNYVLLIELDYLTIQPFTNCFESFQRDPNFLLSRNQANQFIKNLDCLLTQSGYSRAWFSRLFCKLLTKQSILGQATVSNKSIIRSETVCQFMQRFEAAHLNDDNQTFELRVMSRVCIEEGALCREVVDCAEFPFHLIHILRTIGKAITNGAIRTLPFLDYKGLIEILVKLVQIPEKLAMLNKSDVLRVVSSLLVSPDLDFEALCYILRTIRDFLCAWNGTYLRSLDTVDSRMTVINVRHREFGRAQSLEIERLCYSTMMAICQRSSRFYEQEMTEEWLDMHSHQLMTFLKAHPERLITPVGIWVGVATLFSQDPFLHEWATDMKGMIKATILF